MTWLSIIVAGILTYFTRMTMIALVSRDMLGDKIKSVLAYVPSAVFPAIIFPEFLLMIMVNLLKWMTLKYLLQLLL